MREIILGEWCFMNNKLNIAYRRKAGIELLRILAVLMVISVHRMGHQTLFSAPQFSVSYYVLWFIEIASYKAVDIFFIISGYFGITQAFKGKKILLLEFKVLVYCVGFYILSVLVNFQNFNGRDFLRTLFPYIGGHYWYYTAYISLMILSPWINKMIRVIKKQNLLLLILTVSGISTISIGDAFFTNDGYSVIWAINLYIIGAYIRLYCRKLTSVKKSLALTAGCTMFIYIWFVIVGRITQILFGHVVFSTHFMVYRQFPVVLGAIFAVIAFVQIDFKEKTAKIINSVSKCTFGVYLIHSCVFMDTLFWVKLFPSVNASDKAYYWLYVIVSIILMYVVCLIIEMARNKIMSRIEKSKFFDVLYEKIHKIVHTVVQHVSKIGE